MSLQLSRTLEQLLSQSNTSDDYSACQCNGRPLKVAALIYDEIRSTVWQLGEVGVPIHLEQIIEICEKFCKERLL